MKMDRTDSSEMSEATYGSKRCENLEDYKINLRCLKKISILYRFNSDNRNDKQNFLCKFITIWLHTVKEFLQ